MFIRVYIIFSLAAGQIYCIAESPELEKDPHYPYVKRWPYRHRYGYRDRHQAKSEIFHAALGPYRLLGKPPLWTIKPHGCEAVELYMVVRHGERNPGFVPFGENSLKLLEDVLNPLMKKSTGISPSVDVKFPYKIPFRKDEAFLIVPEGDKVMYEIGRRYAKRFPEMLRRGISIANINFTGSCFLRSSQSAMALGLGYLKGHGHVSKLKLQPIPITTYPCLKDNLHDIAPSCPKWTKTIQRNRTTFAESQKFLKSVRFQNIVRKIRRKLGLVGVKELDEQVVVSMFRACGWGVEAFGDSLDQGWCSVFTIDDQKAYDLYADLYMYYLLGPGNLLNKDIMCNLLKDIFTSFQRTAKETTGAAKPKVTVRIGHGHTVMLPLNRLGLFLDKFPLKADADYDKLENREFIYGKIAPMSGNFVFVLFKCPSAAGNGYKIQLYHNERLIKLPACQSKVECTLKELLDYYKDILNDKCDFDQLCKV